MLASVSRDQKAAADCRQALRVPTFVEPGNPQKPVHRRAIGDCADCGGTIAGPGSQNDTIAAMHSARYRRDPAGGDRSEREKPPPPRPHQCNRVIRPNPTTKAIS